jgi:hypothetical protein
MDSLVKPLCLRAEHSSYILNLSCCERLRNLLQGEVAALQSERVVVVCTKGLLNVAERKTRNRLIYFINLQPTPSLNAKIYYMQFVITYKTQLTCAG